MKKQIYLSFFVMIFLTSCASFKYLEYEKSNVGLDKKLPNLALVVDTSSISAIFNQFQYVYQGIGDVLVPNNKCNEAFRDSIIALYDEETWLSYGVRLDIKHGFYGEKEWTSFEMHIFDPDKFLKNEHANKLLSQDIIIEKIKYSMPSLDYELDMNWGSPLIKEDYCQLFLNSDKYCKANPDFLTSMVASGKNTEFDTRDVLKLVNISNPKTAKPDDSRQLPLGSDFIYHQSNVNKNVLFTNLFFSGKYDFRVRDQLAYLKYVVDNNICEQDFKSNGKIKFEVLKYKASAAKGWTIPSVLTLFLINFLGFPVTSQGVELTLKCTITDMNNHEIYSKTVSAKGKGYCAMYWGYGMDGAGNTAAQGGTQRKANMSAISNATNLIIKDIDRNKDKILTALK